MQDIKIKNYFFKILANIFFLGLISGANFSMLSYIIPYKLAINNFSTNYIGLFFLTTVPYCLKPLVAPIIEKYSVYYFCQKLGQRRGWAVFVQLLLTILTYLLFAIETTTNLILTIIITFLISLFAALQDIITDAYRLEHTNTEKEISIISTFGITGFRIGILLGSGGSLLVSHFYNWYYVHLCSFLINVLGIYIAYKIKESNTITRKVSYKLLEYKLYINTLMSGIRLFQNKNKPVLLILIFVLFYKISDTVPMSMGTPMFIKNSYSTFEIACIYKTYGLILMIIGGFISGIITHKIGIKNSIIICGLIQLLSPMSFAILNQLEHNLLYFIIISTIQNFVVGLGSTTLIIFLNTLYSKELIGIQIAIVTSFSSLIRIFLSFLSGVFAIYVTWYQFFIYSTILSSLFLPCFFIYKYKKEKLLKIEN